MHIDDTAFRELTGAKEKFVKYDDGVPAFNAEPLGWILHVSVSNGSLFNYFNNLAKGSRKFSTCWVAKDGTIEQYGSIKRIPWAQAAGNSTYWAVETEGFPTEKLTTSQIHALARLHKAFMLASGRNLDHVISKSGQVGIGTHQMGGTAWGGHSCPGTIRAGQRDDIIARAAKGTYKF